MRRRDDKSEKVRFTQWTVIWADVFAREEQGPGGLQLGSAARWVQIRVTVLALTFHISNIATAEP